MATFAEISLDLRKMSTAMSSRTRSILFEESKSILGELNARSPEDTGYFKSRWRVKLSRISSRITMASITVSNDTLYAPFMDEGATPHQAPWYYPNRHRKGKRRGQFKKGTGKLKIKGGVVWAGGLKPGHSKTIGGQIGPVLINNQQRLDRLSNLFADSIIKGLR